MWFFFLFSQSPEHMTINEGYCFTLITILTSTAKFEYKNYGRNELVHVPAKFLQNLSSHPSSFDLTF